MITLHNDISIDFDVLQYINTSLPSHFEPASDVEYRGCCVFHDERNPSLYVNVETGMYMCHACHAKGNVVRLVQRISRFPTYYDAYEWLLERYGDNIADDADEPFTLRFTDVEPSPIVRADESYATRHANVTHPYMTQERGIPADVLQQFDIGFDAATNSVTIPWRDRHGRLLTVKHRKIDVKEFWYTPRCRELRSHVWALHRCIGADVVYVTEAEIDAMTLWAAGKRAVAIGGSHVSPEQARQLLLSGVQAVVPTCDRDEAGRDADQRVATMAWSVGIDVYQAIWPVTDAKDANQLGVDGCRLITYETPKIFF